MKRSDDQLINTTPVSGGMGMHLLQKMGWRPGEGLGKDKTGALIPLQLEVKRDKKGLVATEENPQAIIKQKRAAGQPFPRGKAQPPPQNLESKHPVSLLGELAAKRKWQPPLYIGVESGPGHKRVFSFKININGHEYHPPEPSLNKKIAKAMAAKFCLQEIGILPRMRQPPAKPAPPVQPVPSVQHAPLVQPAPVVQPALAVLPAPSVQPVPPTPVQQPPPPVDGK